MQNCTMIATGKGEKKHFNVGAQYEDFQRSHAGLSNQQFYSDPEISINIPADMFTVGYLQKTY